jgi:putative heme transporter
MAIVEEAQPGQSLRARVGALAIQLAILAFVFGWLLPRFVDYREVWNAIKGLSWWEFLILFALGAARVPTEAMIYRALLPRLSSRVGSEAYLSQNFAGLVVPPPMSSIVQYAYFRSDGFERQASLVGAVGSFIFPTAGRLALPLVAFVVLVVTGNFKPEALWLAAASVAILLVAGFVIWLVGRSDSSARWVGNQSGHAISWALARFKKEPVTGLGETLVRFRNHTYQVVRDRWLSGAIAVSLNLFLTFVLLLVSLRFVGLSSDELEASSVLAALALAFLAGTILPITGSGLGTVDLVLISALGTLSGNNDLSAAGAMVWRVFYSVLAVPFGVFTLNRFRKRHGALLTEAWTAMEDMKERRAETEESTMPEKAATSGQWSD